MVQAFEIAKVEINSTDVIFFILELLLIVKVLNLNKIKNKTMKSLLLSATMISLLISCNIKSDNGFPGNIITKEGKGIIKTKQFELSFDEIKVSQSISAEIVKSNEEKVVVTAPDDIIDEILVESVNGKLVVKFKPNLNISAKNVAVKIFAKDFSRIEANSSADLKIKDHFVQDKTDIKVSSSGSISGNLEANNMSIDVSSSGTFSGQIWAVDLTSEVSSSGDANLSGKTKNAKFDVSSSGTINAQKVIAENAIINASSSGDASLSVSNQLMASASSSGDINITRKGSLNIVSKKESSGGSVNIR